MKKILITIVFSVLGIMLFAQSGTLAFLRLNTDARNAGMGNVGMGEATGMYLYTNPTSFLMDSTKTVYGSYTLGLPPKMEDKQVMFHSASVGYKRGKQALFVGVRYFGGMEVVKMNSTGTKRTVIKPYDYSVDVTYARDLGNNLSAYITGSFIESYIGKTAYTGSGSAGIYYRNAFTFAHKNVTYNVGVGVYDLGGDVKYGKKSYKQPTSVGIGGSFHLEDSPNHNMGLYWSGRYFVLPAEASGFTGGLGMEYEMYNMLAVRVGYHMDKKNSMPTLGLGIKQNCFALNFAWQVEKDYNSFFLGGSFKF